MTTEPTNHEDFREARTMEIAKGMVAAMEAIGEKNGLDPSAIKSAAMICAIELAACQLGPREVATYLRGIANIVEDDILSEAVN